MTSTKVHFSEPDNHIVKGLTTAFMCHESGSETIIIEEHTVVVFSSFPANLTQLPTLSESLVINYLSV